MRPSQAGETCFLLYLQRKQSRIHALQHDQWVTVDHTKLDNHADMKKADSQTKKNWWLYEGTARRRQDLGVPFQFACHLRTPTHHLRRAQWTLDGEMSSEKTSTHTSSYSEEVPWSADTEREAATMISWWTFKGRKHWAALSAVVLCRWSRAAQPR